MKFPLCVGIASTILLSAGCANSQPIPGYQLVWADEFNHDGLPDGRKWSYDTWRNKDGWWNNEAQYYAAARLKNTRVENGHLIIEVHREDLSKLADFGGQAYSSGRLITRDKAEWTYGFFDIRAKLACNRGGWPAIWMLGKAWPENGEIDIMEQLSFDPGTVYATAHTPYSIETKTPTGAESHISDPCNAFHNYQLEWTPDYLRFLIDGKAVHEFRKPANATPQTWPFDTPQYLLLNVAMGGGWAGQKGIDDTALPAHMDVDYVRVYQKR